MIRNLIVHLEREAARRYDLAFRACLAAELRAKSRGGLDQEIDDRLTLELAHAARRWERSLIALGQPIPPDLIAVMVRLSLP